MTKKKVIIITSIVITLGLLLTFCLNLYTKKDTNKSDSSVTTINSKTENKDDQLNVSDNNIQEKEEDVKKEEVKEEPKKETSNNISNKTSEPKKESNNNVNNTKQETSVPVVQEQPKVQEQPAPTQPAKQSGPWEAWEMTEYEYYNEPYPKGARVDYPVSSCGSESGCLSACASKGDTYVGYIYSCDIITSASGKFLGVMLDLEKVN